MKNIYISEMIRREFDWELLERALAEALCSMIDYEELASDLAEALSEEVQTAAAEVANEATYL